ncbi:membrane protein [Pullulanibacillus camelliae]|uniref:Membrane protein n=1 Tax=Pullulanibacillus camelliae TaxID=1707096 RepID=A0A8J2YJP7_9BACL|nr:membrane protein [Pullulanibacillus camelliae]
MIQQILGWLDHLGTVGLLLTMFIEGLSVPFPGIIIVLAYGYVMNFNIWESLLMALVMSAIYTIASFIPYLLGYKLDAFFKKRLKKSIDKARGWFNKYGLWSIAVTRPFGIGNYISYVAGISKVKWLPYGLLTLVGIFPWAFVMIFIGREALQIVHAFF